MKTVMGVFVLVSIATVAAADAEETPETRGFLMGFQDFAYDHTEEGSKSTYAFLRENADLVCLQFGEDCPWKEAAAGDPFPEALLEKMEKRKAGVGLGKRIYLEISPLNMGRSAMGGEIPPEIEGKPFNDPLVKKAFITYAQRMQRFFQPAYLCIGIEVNELLDNSPKLWPGYVDLYKATYAALKKDNPRLPVFATLTLHSLLSVRNRGHEESLEKIQAFVSLNDVAGISFYPFLGGHRDPGDPTKNFDWIRDFVGDKPVAITETAYPAEPIVFAESTVAADTAAQVDYLETVFKMADRDDYRFVINFAHRDYDYWWEKNKDQWPEWVKAWKDTGILDGDGAERPSYSLWKSVLGRPYQRDAK